MTTSDPTTEQIVQALRVCFEKTCTCSDCPFEHESCGNIEQVAADRLESQAKQIAELTAAIKTQSDLCRECAALTVIEQKAEIAALTDRAEQAEKERDAANERVTDYELSSRGF